MDNPERNLEPVSPDQPKIGGNKRQSFRVPTSSSKSQQPAPEPAEVDKSSDFPVEKSSNANFIEKSTEDNVNGKAFQEKKLLNKGRRPGDRYIRLTRPAIAPNQVWEGRDLYVKVDTTSPGTGF